MGFEKSRRAGRTWEDVLQLDEVIRDTDFVLNHKTERDFENALSSTLRALKGRFSNQVITQQDKSSTVRSVYLFGKRHRPDMTLGEDGIAIEVKYVTYAGLKEAIGQGFFYRVRYRFVFLVLVISEERRGIYTDIAEEKEKDLTDTLEYLAETMNIFTYIVPAFKKLPVGVESCHSFFKPK